MVSAFSARRLSLTLLVALASWSARAGDPNRFRRDTTLLNIHRQQDARATAPLLAYLRHANPIYRAEAAEAFASVQSKEALGPLKHLLTTDADAGVRRAAARALGLLADTTAQTDLMRVAQKETDARARATELEALGRVATAGGGGLRYLTEESLPTEPVARTGWAWGIYRTGQRGIATDLTVARAIALLGADEPAGVRLAAAHFLARTPRLDLTTYEGPLLAALRTDTVAERRVPLVQALGRVKTGKVADALVNLLCADRTPRVRVAAMRAVNGLRYEQVKEAAWDAVAEPDYQVAMAAAEYFVQKISPEERVALFLRRALRLRDPQVQATLLAATLKLAAPQPDTARRIIQKIKDRYALAPTDTRRGFLLRALGQSALAYEFIAQETFTSPLRPGVASAGIEALVAIRSRPDFPKDLTPAFNALLQKAVASGDVALVGTAAGALRDPSLGFREQLPDLGFLRQARQKLQLPRDVETAQELDQTLAFLENKPPPAPLPPAFTHRTDWNRVLKIPAGQLVTVTTNRGLFTMELLIDEAPATAATFTALVQQKFYDGRLFHRVVPNFVVQGGDPRGDGWGGLDYTLRSELADESFTTGAVGLASAGLNTESCQWFVMHCPAPHLDGRYTLFARVVKGQDVVNRLQVGDVIEKVRLR